MNDNCNDLSNDLLLDLLTKAQSLLINDVILSDNVPQIQFCG